MTFTRGERRTAAAALTAGALLTTGLLSTSGTAQAAAYDPTPLCVSPDGPSSPELVQALATVRAASASIATGGYGFDGVAQGFVVPAVDAGVAVMRASGERASGNRPAAVRALAARAAQSRAGAARAYTATSVGAAAATDPSSTATFRYDGTAVRNRFDARDVDPDTNAVEKVHWITDHATSAYYDGYRVKDDHVAAAGLRVLGVDQVWVKTAASPADVTADAVIAEGFDYYSEFGYLEGAAAEPDLVPEACAVEDGKLRLIDSIAGADFHIVDVLSFTDTGALKRIDVQLEDPADPDVTLPLYQETWTYGPTTVGAPVPSVTPERWKRAYVLGTFQDLEKASLSAGQKAVSKKSSNSARVAALRSAVTAQAKGYKVVPARRTTVSGGIRVQVHKPGTESSNWSFTFTVSGKKVKVSDNT